VVKPIKNVKGNVNINSFNVYGDRISGRNVIKGDGNVIGKGKIQQSRGGGLLEAEKPEAPVRNPIQKGKSTRTVIEYPQGRKIIASPVPEPAKPEEKPPEYYIINHPNWRKNIPPAETPAKGESVQDFEKDIAQLVTQRKPKRPPSGPYKRTFRKLSGGAEELESLLGRTPLRGWDEVTPGPDQYIAKSTPVRGRGIDEITPRPDRSMVEITPAPKRKSEPIADLMPLPQPDTSITGRFIRFFGRKPSTGRPGAKERSIWTPLGGKPQRGRSLQLSQAGLSRAASKESGLKAKVAGAFRSGTLGQRPPLSQSSVVKSLYDIFGSSHEKKTDFTPFTLRDSPRKPLIGQGRDEGVSSTGPSWQKALNADPSNFIKPRLAGQQAESGAARVLDEEQSAKRGIVNRFGRYVSNKTGLGVQRLTEEEEANLEDLLEAAPAPSPRLRDRVRGQAGKVTAAVKGYFRKPNASPEPAEPEQRAEYPGPSVEPETPVQAAPASFEDRLSEFLVAHNAPHDIPPEDYQAIRNHFINSGSMDEKQFKAVLHEYLFDKVRVSPQAIWYLTHPDGRWVKPPEVKARMEMLRQLRLLAAEEARTSQ